MLALAAIALAVRVALVVSVSPALAVDSGSYLDLAHRLASGHLHGSPGARTPGYPAILLALGYSPRAVWYLQALAGVAATLLLYRLVRRLGGAAPAAFAAALLYGIDLEFLALERTILTETIACVLILLAAALTVEVAQRRAATMRWALALGVTLAVLCLVRPDAAALTAYLAAALAVVAVRTRRRAPRPLAIGAAVVLPAVLVLGAWAAVNRSTIGVTTVSTVLGYNMIDHVAPYVRAQPGPDRAITAAYVAARTRRERHSDDLANLSADAQPAMERAAHLDAAHLSGRLLGIALGVIARHPAAYLASSVKQWPRFFLAPNYAYGIARGGAAGAIRAAWKVERGLRLLICAAFALLCVTAIGLALARRAGPLHPASAVLAGAVAVGMLVASFLAFGETGRYGTVYYPLILAVTASVAWPRSRSAEARDRSPRMGPERLRLVR